jgi:hypothetical protein
MQNPIRPCSGGRLSERGNIAKSKRNIAVPGAIGCQVPGSLIGMWLLCRKGADSHIPKIPFMRPHPVHVGDYFRLAR